MDRSPSQPDHLRLDDQLCFALYAATHAITRAYRPLLSEIGLTYPQYLVMLTLWQDGASAIGHIARRLELDSHAVTPLIRRLEADGFVVRRRGVDRRHVVIELTPHGVELEEAAARAQLQVVCGTGLSDPDLAVLRRQLRDLSSELTSTHTSSEASAVENDGS
ncbi:MarR family winged helix-turn-helix transcriptional regulator [Aeromicrobium sp. CF3.5]|uniref:MarR family winged helix-turn-helix transcriptional regulator n=1 Tax=Aeromicrobium sp. CF3.5 TaxID=3373078 RepID=UPI003EE583EC